MTETTKRPIAETIRKAEKPTGRSFELANQAARLMRALKVAQQWSEAAAKVDAAGEMWEHAETVYDEIQEELLRVVWEIEISREKRREEVFSEEREERLRSKNPEAVARASALSDSLIEAYNILSSVPQHLLGLGGDESSERTRYKLVGALLAAQEAADAKRDGHEL